MHEWKTNEVCEGLERIWRGQTHRRQRFANVQFCHFIGMGRPKRISCLSHKYTTPTDGKQYVKQHPVYKKHNTGKKHLTYDIQTCTRAQQTWKLYVLRMDWKWTFWNCEVKCREGRFKLQKETVQIYSSNDRHQLSIGKTPAIPGCLLCTD